MSACLTLLEDRLETDQRLAEDSATTGTWTSAWLPAKKEEAESMKMEAIHSQFETYLR